jgi:hypothetical protein
MKNFIFMTVLFPSLIFGDCSEIFKRKPVVLSDSSEKFYEKLSTVWWDKYNNLHLEIQYEDGYSHEFIVRETLHLQTCEGCKRLKEDNSILNLLNL